MNCRNFSRDSKGYSRRPCSWHTCQRAGCSEQSRTDNSNSPYCATHRCANMNCLGEAKIPNGHCVQEACMLPQCGLPKASPHNSFCIDHLPQPAQISYSTSPTIGYSRSSNRYNSSSSRQRPVGPYAPVPDGMSVYFEGPSTSGSSNPWYARANLAFRDGQPRGGYRY